MLALSVACGRGADPPVCAQLELPADACLEAQALRLPAALPAARGNAVADVIGAADLGFAVFFDARFSADQNVRCASCHLPERHFQDGLPLPRAAGFVPRHTPTTLNAAWMSWQMWDGRADSLWSQPLLALENPAEMNYTRLEIAHQLRTLYVVEYQAVFGPLPDLSDAARYPPRGAPGMPAWDSMARADQDVVNRIAANLGKAFEAYLRKQAAGKARLDQFLGGDATALSGQEKRGLTVFVQAKCAACHSGPMLSDVRFHNIGVPAATGQPPDRGRAAGLQILLASTFNARGPFFDGTPAADEAGLYQSTPGDEGAFRTPSLRNLNFNAPYGHNGTFGTLEEMVDFHLRGGGRGQSGFAGEVDPLLQPQALSADDRAALLAFLRSLDGVYPTLPWADWPHP